MYLLSLLPGGSNSNATKPGEANVTSAGSDGGDTGQSQGAPNSGDTTEDAVGDDVAMEGAVTALDAQPGTHTASLAALPSESGVGHGVPGSPAE